MPGHRTKAEKAAKAARDRQKRREAHRQELEAIVANPAHPQFGQAVKDLRAMDRTDARTTATKAAKAEAPKPKVEFDPAIDAAGDVAAQKFLNWLDDKGPEPTDEDWAAVGAATRQSMEAANGR